MGNTSTISAFLFQAEAEAEPEEGTNPPPPKRLRSDELTRVIVILPNGQRHQLDISRESTLMVSDVNKENKWSLCCLPFAMNIINQMYAQDQNIWHV